jgi:heme exporter protein B
LTKLWWIIQKDLVCEWRACLVWPRLLALGLAVACLLSYQMSASPVETRQMAGTLCWLTICFASVLTLGSAIALEHEEGCWDGLLHYPIRAHTVYLAKLFVNVVALGTLQCVVIPFFMLTSGTALSAYTGEMLLVSLLGNLGISSLGTLVGAMSSGIRQSQGLLALLLLPLLVPVILAASAATNLIFVEQIGLQWWRWVQLLGAFAIVYITAGLVLFEFAIED